MFFETKGPGARTLSSGITWLSAVQLGQNQIHSRQSIEVTNEFSEDAKMGQEGEYVSIPGRSSFLSFKLLPLEVTGEWCNFKNSQLGNHKRLTSSVCEFLNEFSSGNIPRQKFSNETQKTIAELVSKKSRKILIQYFPCYVWVDMVVSEVLPHPECSSS